nr:cation transporter [Methylomarinum vadi]
MGLFLLSGLFLMPTVQAESPARTQDSTQSVILDVQNMTCAICPITIRKALQAVNGVQSAKVDFGSKTAKVTFDPQKTNTAALIKATTNAGYPATVHSDK